MSFVFPKSQTIPLGIVVRKSPGMTRWAKWVWRVVDILPGAGPADWTVLRDEAEVTEYHAATVPLSLYVSDTEAYLHEMSTRAPSVYIVLSPDESRQDRPWKVMLATASPYEAQDYCDSAEEVVEKVAMPQGLEAWVRDFVEQFHQDEVFVKRRRDKQRVDQTQDGIGDPRVQTGADVYASPTLKRRRMI